MKEYTMSTYHERTAEIVHSTMHGIQFQDNACYPLARGHQS